MKPVRERMMALVLMIILIIVNYSQAEIVEETGSLLEFFSGHEERCAYDNWVSHVSEGIIRAGYNDYGPAELDRQTNGFGGFQILDSLPDPNAILQDWYQIFAHIVAGNLDTASAILDTSYLADVYEIVHLRDRGSEYIIVREVLNDEYFDDNGTEEREDDVTGSFDFGWGLYIFNMNPRTPEVILEVPHPCDDFITPHVAMDAFQLLGAGAMFVSGCSREMEWTQQGTYDNSKSRSDPTRTMNLSIFSQAHMVVVDSIDSEFVIPIHSYDSNGRDLSQCLLSTYPDNYPESPINDGSNHFDILNLTPLYPIPANTIGNAEHAAVRVDNYYAIWNYGDNIFYRGRFLIPTNMPSLNGWVSPQRNYSQAHVDTGRYFENYMHVEHDEFPDVITEALLEFYPAGGVPTYHTYANAVAFYRPLYQAVDDFFHRSRFHTVPDDYEGIQTAIDESFGGDTILVRPGMYRENINYRGKSLQIVSQFVSIRDPQYIDSTIISGENNGSTVTFPGGETEKTKLVGFTITGGRSLDGAGIYMEDNRPTIEHCLIFGNNATGFGGGIMCGSAHPKIINCTITGNTAVEGGGGVFCWGGAGPDISNSILWNNQPDEVYYLRFSEPNLARLSYSDIDGGQEHIILNNNGNLVWGNSNIELDPMFVASHLGDFHLQLFSPCVNGGDPDSPFDLDNSISDIGAFAITYRDFTVDPDPVEFIDHHVDIPDSARLTVMSMGRDSVAIIGYEIQPAGSPFRVTGSIDSTRLAQGDTTELWVVFSPVAVNEYLAELTIIYNHSDQDTIPDTMTVPIYGNALKVASSEPVTRSFGLTSIYPNPFNSSVTISFGLDKSAPTRLAIYDLSGRMVADLRPGRLPAPHEWAQEVVWEADGMGSGVYFVRLEAAGQTSVRKVMLLR